MLMLAEEGLWPTTTRTALEAEGSATRDLLALMRARGDAKKHAEDDGVVLVRARTCLRRAGGSYGSAAKSSCCNLSVQHRVKMLRLARATPSCGIKAYGNGTVRLYKSSMFAGR